MQIKGKKFGRRPVKAETDIAPEATDLLFEVEDVAQVLAEVTGEDVNVTADENTVEFEIAGETYTCEAEGDEEIVESSARPSKSMRRVAASTVRRPGGRVIRKRK